MTWIQWVSLGALYLLGAAVWVVWAGYRRYDDTGPATVLGAIFWPVALPLAPVFAAYSLGEKLREAKRPEWLKRKPPDNTPICPKCNQRTAYR